MHVLSPQQSNGSLPPTYRSFAFAESLEGTKASLARHKANMNATQPDPYLPSNYDSMRMGMAQGQTSVLLQEEGLSDSGFSDRRGETDTYGVPFAARYSEPSRKELQSTQPIPPEIVSQRR